MKPTPQAIENAARAGEPCPGLRPCPFCGEKKIYFNLPDPETGFRGSFNCPACLASMPNETGHIEELIGCWNHREPADLRDMVLVPRADYKRLLLAAENDDMIVWCETCGAWLDRDDPATVPVSDYTGCWKTAAGEDSDRCKSYRAMLAAAEDER